MNLFKLIPLSFVCIGLILLGGGVYLFTSTRTFIDRSVVTAGSVRAIASEWSDEGSRIYYPIITFTTATGERINFQSKLGSSAQLYTVDEAVSVRYDPADPTSARLNTFWALWFSTIIFSVLGSIFVGIGTLVYYLLWWRPQAASDGDTLHVNGFTVRAKRKPSP